MGAEDPTVEVLYGVRRAAQAAELAPPGKKRREAEIALVEEVLDAAKALGWKSISGQMKAGAAEARGKRAPGAPK